MHAAILTTMEPPIDAGEWDVNPIRDLLIALMGDTVFVRGDVERDLMVAESAGLLEYRCATGDDLAGRPVSWSVPPVFPVWVVSTTLAGRHLALRIAHSAELCRILDVAADVGDIWRGVDLRLVFNELNLRDGGAGQVSDWRAWAKARERTYLCELPRRGLDAAQQHA